VHQNHPDFKKKAAISLRTLLLKQKAQYWPTDTLVPQDCTGPFTLPNLPISSLLEALNCSEIKIKVVGFFGY